MVVGFNHNFRYKGEVYHIQTEDGGLKYPNIVTLLYRGGTILRSRKTSYADITKVDSLEQVVEELMKEQHKEMLRQLKAGDFDEIIAGVRPASQTAVEQAQAASFPPPAPVRQPPAEAAAKTILPTPAAEPAAVKPAPPKPEPPGDKAPSVELGLDDIILSYLVGDDK